jgi:hypothetical protein
MTPTDLEKYRETIEAAELDSDAVLSWVGKIGRGWGTVWESNIVFALLDLAHSRGERIKELEKEIEKLRETKYPW